MSGPCWLCAAPALCCGRPSGEISGLSSESSDSFPACPPPWLQPGTPRLLGAATFIPLAVFYHRANCKSCNFYIFWPFHISRVSLTDQSTLATALEP